MLSFKYTGFFFYLIVSFLVSYLTSLCKNCLVCHFCLFTYFLYCCPIDNFFLLFHFFGVLGPKYLKLSLVQSVFQICLFFVFLFCNAFLISYYWFSYFTIFSSFSRLFSKFTFCFYFCIFSRIIYNK